MTSLKFYSIALAGLLTSGLLSACGENTTPEHAPHEPGAASDHGETTAGEDAKGPHGGKLLKKDDFAVEVTIFETGIPPQYRLYMYAGGERISPREVTATVTLGRLDGEQNVFNFTAENDYLSGDGVVGEPHSFDVTVKARYKGQTYQWSYESHEGRTKITSEMAQKMGIGIDRVGPAVIEETIEVLGDIEFAPNASAELKARYAGKIQKVLKVEGETVQKGDILAKIESNETLQSYYLKAPMSGVIVTSRANSGDIVNTEKPLFMIGDLTRLKVDFHIYGGDLKKVKPGQPVVIRSMGDELEAETTLEHYLPTMDGASQTTIIHSELSNPEKRWLPGMKVKGFVVYNRKEVPLAVRTKALQAFRDFTVVFAQVGDQYEVRMLELGDQTEEWTEVLSGIKAGQAYVSENSFIIKADIEKSGASHDH